MNSDNLAWLTGFLEGEGAFNRESGREKRRVRIAVTSTDRDVVEHLARIVPGSRFNGPYAPSAGSLGNKPTYRWVLAIRPLVIELAKQLRPLMCERRQGQIDALLAHAAAHPALRARGAPASHGTRIRYARGCDCEACHEAANAYQRYGRAMRKAAAAMPSAERAAS
jgi:hypothetical protein